MSNRILIIRVDCNPVIASGHLMRCIALAEEARESGMSVIFVMSDENSRAVLSSYGFNLINLNSDWRNLRKELPEIKQLLKKYHNPIYLIDTYSIDSDYVESLNSLAHTVYLGSKEDYLGNLSMLINYSAKIDRDSYHNRYSKTKLLLGVEYAPLRKEFSLFEKKTGYDELHVLLTTGNTDNENYMGKILSRISPAAYENIFFDVVVGNMFKHADTLIREYSSPKNVTFHRNVIRISELMGKSSLAISAAGTTIYELAAARVPAIVFSMVSEQVASAEGMQSLGIIEYCGEIFKDEACLDNINLQFGRYIESECLRKDLSELAYSRIDGRGCHKIITEMYKLS